jgi:hypothetical protein
MRRWAISATLLLAACIPSGERKPPPSSQAQRTAARETLQCLADLRREGVRYKALEDRIFGNGCTALGAVQLLDVGTPVANLGAMICPLARQFARWTREAMQPAAMAWLGSRVARVESFGTYGCRTVNSRPGARLSEHGRANAVDVAAFVLADGRRITVKDGWRSDDEDVRRFLRNLHAAACRRFGIVLGPDADAFHRDHLHFDMGQGPYCR